MVGFCSKGPINVPTLITSTRQLHTVFGYAHPDASDPYMIYAAEQYLAAANQLYIVRVANEEPVSDERAEVAFVEVPSAGKVIEIESTVPGPYTITNDKFFRFKINGVLSAKTLVVSGRNEDYETAELADELNDQIDSNNDGIIFYVKVVGSNSYLAVKTVYAYGPNASLELVSVQDSLYGENSLIGSSGTLSVLGTGMTKASVMGSVAGPYDITGITNPRLNIVLDGTDNVLIDNVVQTVDLDLSGEVTAEDVVDSINSAVVNLPGGFVAKLGTLPGDSDESGANVVVIETLHTGRDARIRIKPDSTVDYTLGLNNNTATGTSPESLTGENSEQAGVVYGAENSKIILLLCKYSTMGCK